VFNKVNVLNEYVQCVIGYIRFGPFVDMKYEESSKKVLLDKFGRVYFCVGEFQVCCHLS